MARATKVSHTFFILNSLRIFFDVLADAVIIAGACLVGIFVAVYLAPLTTVGLVIFCAAYLLFYALVGSKPAKK
jgi:hypothetical protein